MTQKQKADKFDEMVRNAAKFSHELEYPTGNSVLSVYDHACRDIADMFNRKYFEGQAEMYPIGGEVDGIWGVNDYFFSIQNMFQALELNLSENDLFAWYDQWIGNKKPSLNMKNFKYLIDGKLK